jgi:7-cyano-7-deazaguanine reductase
LAQQALQETAMLTRKQIKKVSKMDAQLSSLAKGKMAGLKALGNSAVNKKLYKRSRPDPKLLESFPMPKGQGMMLLHIEAPEFTSLCPLTGQPDFAKIVIDYMPDGKCVESKALKLYLGSFRNHGSFHEAVVRKIADDLILLLDPKVMRVKGEFTPRGGIPFWPTVNYYKTPKDWSSFVFQPKAVSPMGVTKTATV